METWYKLQQARGICEYLLSRQMSSEYADIYGNVQRTAFKSLEHCAELLFPLNTMHLARPYYIRIIRFNKSRAENRAGSVFGRSNSS